MSEWLHRRVPWARALAPGLAVLAALLLAPGCAKRPADGVWIELFNGRDLSHWVVKIAGHAVGEDTARTFRVEDGVLKVRYDRYGAFDGQFGHLYYERPFSRYHLIVEYRIVGDWLPDVPEWARRNSGVMLHAQDPRTVSRDQDFPISVEMQLLAGLGDGQPRPTANMCSPGTDVTMDGRPVSDHCVNSTSRTYEGDGWVRAEAIVLGDSLITHIVDGDTVLRYTAPRIGGGVVTGYDSAQKVDGRPLRSGYIALQGEGQPVEFRRVALRALE
jgi:hypothetical protein